MITSLEHSNEGFTLLELIVTIVLAAIVGTIMYEYSGTILTQSALPLTQVRQALALQKVMENIFTDYKVNYSTNLAGIKSNIGDEGTSQNNSYGQYYVVHNHFIKFVDNTETPIEGGDPQNILKVTIQNDLNERLSVLLTE